MENNKSQIMKMNSYLTVRTLNITLKELSQDNVYPIHQLHVHHN